ncbi:MAG: hypothetical protein ACKOEX_08475 [Planctomycetia bacterium]
MRDDLVGYLMGALDDPQRKQVDDALADPRDGAALRRDLDRLRMAVMPLARDRMMLDPPPGLAQRTLAFVQARSVATPAPMLSPAVEPAVTVGGARIWLDRIIIAASALAAAILVAPLLLDAIVESRARRAERNLHTISSALQGYAESHRAYPTPPDSGPLSRAGLYAPTLVSEHRLAADDGTVLVPGARRGSQKHFRIPTVDELKEAVGTPKFEELVKSMGGDFGYTLGHRDASGRLMPNLNQRREHHPIMADAPDTCCEKSSNHPEGIHYILFEDGHVERVFLKDLHEGDDHLYRNDDGETAAADDPEDAVIGDSHHQP